MVRRCCIGMSGFVLAAAGLLAPVAGANYVSNPSFESPQAPQPVSLTTNYWVLNGTGTIVNVPGFGNIPGGTGVFPNPANPNDGSPVVAGQPYSNGHLDGADGNDVAYIFSNTGNSITQALYVDPSVSSPVPITFTAGQKYTLTASIAYAQNKPSATDRLAYELYYVDNSNVTHVVMEGDLSNSVASPAINQQTLQDYSFSTAFLAVNDASIGQQINVGFFPLDNSGGEFDIDNVRLTSVPEPAAIGLVSLAGIGLMRGRRRRTA
jgi:hypothetical protein